MVSGEQQSDQFAIPAQRVEQRKLLVLDQVTPIETVEDRFTRFARNVDSRDVHRAVFEDGVQVAEYVVVGAPHPECAEFGVLKIVDPIVEPQREVTARRTARVRLHVKVFEDACTSFRCKGQHCEQGECPLPPADHRVRRLSKPDRMSTRWS